MQLFGPVRRHGQQRDTGLVRFDDSGMKFRRRRAAGRDHRRRHPRRPSQAQGEEAGRPLVEHDVKTKLLLLGPFGQGHQQRRGTRAGAHHGIGHAGPQPLVDHHSGKRGLDILGGRKAGHLGQKTTGSADVALSTRTFGQLGGPGPARWC